MKFKERVYISIGILGGLSLGLALGFMICMYGIGEAGSKLPINNVNFEINESKMVEYTYEYMCKKGEINCSRELGVEEK
jgi:hypothetical protein